MIVGGIVVSQPDARDALARTNLRVEAGHLLILRLRSGQVSNLADGIARTVRGLVLVQAPPFTDFRYGDRVRTEGKLKTPTNMGDFDYREYLARQDVYSIMSHPRVMSLARDQGFAPFAWLAPFWQSVARCKTKPDVTFVLVGILSGKNRHRDIA